MGFKGVYKAPIGTTMRVASSLEEGQTFQLRRTPSRSSCAWMLLMSMVIRRAAAFAGPPWLVDTGAAVSCAALLSSCTALAKAALLQPTTRLVWPPGGDTRS